jgi:hypothetical protein
MRSKKGNPLHKKGNPFPNLSDNGQCRSDYPSMISAALRKDLGHVRGAAKTVMQWTGASERTVKNWLAGVEAPTSEHLISLVRHSDSVLVGFLQICGRAQGVSLDRLHRVRSILHEATQCLEEIGNGL